MVAGLTGLSAIISLTIWSIRDPEGKHPEDKWKWFWGGGGGDGGA